MPLAPPSPGLDLENINTSSPTGPREKKVLSARHQLARAFSIVLLVAFSSPTIKTPLNPVQVERST